MADIKILRRLILESMNRSTACSDHNVIRHSSDLYAIRHPSVFDNYPEEELKEILENQMEIWKCTANPHHEWDVWRRECNQVLGEN